MYLIKELVSDQIQFNILYFIIYFWIKIAPLIEYVKLGQTWTGTYINTELISDYAPSTKMSLRSSSQSLLTPGPRTNTRFLWW